jgi:hypothetical protein
MREDARTLLNSTTFRVACRIIEPADAREGNRASAHWTRFERDVKVATHEALGLKRLASEANGEHFRMSRRIIPFPRAVSGARNHRTFAQNGSAYGHLTTSEGGARLGKGDVEAGFIALCAQFRLENNLAATLALKGAFW